jgi:hypothetical protein
MESDKRERYEEALRLSRTDKEMVLGWIKGEVDTTSVAEMCRLLTSRQQASHFSGTSGLYRSLMCYRPVVGVANSQSGLLPMSTKSVLEQ